MKPKNLFICLCVLLIAGGCRTPQKIISSTTETITSSEKQSEAASSEIHNFADTTKKQEVEVTYFKIEFYPPYDDNPGAIPDDPAFLENLSGSTGSSSPKKPPNSKGAIKSIEGYTVSAKIEQSSVSESKENTQVTRNSEKSEDISRQAEINEQPAPDPYRWRYIFWIIVLIIAIITYFSLRKKGIVAAIVSFFTSIFKNN